ncbi:MAG: type II CAAX endopeptidase family protein [Bacteroidota bacterium]
MKYNRLFVFLISTFFITWICWWSLVILVTNNILSYGQVLFTLLFVIGGLGPTVSAFLSIAIAKGNIGFREYNKCLFKWRLNVFWFVIPFVIVFGIAFVSIGLNMLMIKGFNLNLQRWYMIIPFFILMVIGGGLEELGWRGIALPELENKFTPLMSSLILSIIWTLWHLPLFFIKGTNQYGCSFLIFYLGVIGLTLILTWIYNQTESLLICIVFHASYNMVAAMGLTTVLVQPGEIASGMVNTLLIVIVGLILLLIYPKRKRFKKNNEVITKY